MRSPPLGAGPAQEVYGTSERQSARTLGRRRRPRVQSEGTAASVIIRPFNRMRTPECGILSERFDLGDEPSPDSRPNEQEYTAVFRSCHCIAPKNTATPLCETQITRAQPEAALPIGFQWVIDTKPAPIRIGHGHVRAQWLRVHDDEARHVARRCFVHRHSNPTNAKTETPAPLPLGGRQQLILSAPERRNSGAEALVGGHRDPLRAGGSFKSSGEFTTRQRPLVARQYRPGCVAGVPFPRSQRDKQHHAVIRRWKLVASLGRRALRSSPLTMIAARI